MASTIKIKRSGVSGKQPNTATLSVGELAINYKDQKLYSSNGTSVFEIGGASGGLVTTTTKTLDALKGSDTVITGVTAAVSTNYLQVANASATYATKAYAAANSYVKSTLANTNFYIATKVNSTTFNSALANTNSWIKSQLANTNSYIATRATWSALTATNTAIRTLVSDRLQVANAAAIYQTKAVERAALANTNSYISAQATRITLINTNLTATNTAIRALDNQKLSVANAVATYATKSNPATSGLLAHTGRATISTNLAVTGNTTISGQTFLASGSVSAPSLSVTGDTNTGLFFPAADTIAFAEGGTEAMRINSTGNLGLGTSSPNFNGSIGTVCHINNAASDAGTTVWAINHYTNGKTGSAANDGTIVGQLDSDAYLFNYEAGNIILGTSSSERMRIDSIGRLGIGTTPTSQFHIYGSDPTQIIESTNTGQYASARLRLRGPASSTRSTDFVHGNDNAGGTNTYFAIEGTDVNYTYQKTMAIFYHASNYWLFPYYAVNGASWRAPIFYDSDNTGYYWNPGDSSAHRFQTPSGYVHIGPMNSGFTHYQTDRANHYFNTNIQLDGVLYDYNNTAYYWDGNNTSKMYRIINGPYAGSTSSGNVTGLEIQNAGGTGDGNAAAISFHCQGTYGIHLHLRPDGYFGLGGWSSSSWRWYSAPDGTMVASGNVVAYSDPRLKEDITLIESPIEKINKLNGVRFRWKNTSIIGDPGGYDYGVLANEVQSVLPELVVDTIHDSPDGDKYKGVAYDKLTALLIEGMKEQQKQIEELLNRIKVLEQK